MDGFKPSSHLHKAIRKKDGAEHFPPAGSTNLHTCHDLNSLYGPWSWLPEKRMTITVFKDPYNRVDTTQAGLLTMAHRGLVRGKEGVRAG